jgi:hypothetical protein
MEIYVKNDQLLLEYSLPDNHQYFWNIKQDIQKRTVTIKRIFHFSAEDVKLCDEENCSIVFVLGVTDASKNYFVISDDKLGINKSVLFEKDITFKQEYFIAPRGISVFKHLAKVVTSDTIIIGNDDSSNLKLGVFHKMLKKFPNSTELDKYANMRIATVIREEIPSLDADALYQAYMNSKISKTVSLHTMTDFAGFETEKYTLIRKTLDEMLNTAQGYNEKTWQNKIAEILQMIFPKYICVLNEMPIYDGIGGKRRRVDFGLVDYNGNVDLVEIKRPADNQTVTDTLYRDNYVPQQELSWTVKQLEKYIFHLNRWGKEGEERLTKCCQRKGFSDISVKIVNPSGIIIMGREQGLSSEQKEDFEVIKRKYKSIVDIITYDDLLRRLDLLIWKFRQK